MDNQPYCDIADGIERDMNTINTEEVESISVLKDAALRQYSNGMKFYAISITNKRNPLKPKVYCARICSAYRTSLSSILMRRNMPFNGMRHGNVGVANMKLIRMKKLNCSEMVVSLSLSM